MPIGKEIISPCGQKSESPRSCSFLGFLLILLQWIRNHQVRVVLLAVIQPFANIVGNYACRTGDKKRDYNIHAVHLLPLSGIGWTTQVLYHRTMRTERLDLKHILGWGISTCRGGRIRCGSIRKKIKRLLQNSIVCFS